MARTVANNRLAVRDFRNCLEFDGDNDYVNCGHSANLDITGNITIIAWIYLNELPSVAGNDFRVVYKRDATNGYQMYIISADNTLHCHFRGLSDNYLSGTGTPFEKHKWYMVTVVWDGTNMISYINGVQDLIDDSSGTINSGAAIDLTFSGTSQFFNGKIDEGKVYNRALSATEIQNIYYYDKQYTEGLVGHWKMDEGTGSTVEDSSGHGNTGTITGASWKHGRTDSCCLSFDGTDDYINCGNDSSLNITDAITIEAWVKLDATASSWQYIAGRDYTQWELAINPDNRIVFNKKSGAGYEGHVWSQIISKEVWHHIVLTFFLSSKTAHMYWDGSEVSSAFTYATGEIGNANTVIIGKRLSSQDYSNGSIDGVKIYNRALSAGEIEQHFHSIFKDETGLVAHWGMNEGIGGTTADSSNNNNTGTINGATWTREAPKVFSKTREVAQ